MLVLRDITESSRLEAELVRASKLESVGVLAGGIAHDFNNLLSIVGGNLTLALLDEKTAATGGRWLREAERGMARAKELTQQLLTFAKGGEPVRAAVAPEQTGRALSAVNIAYFGGAAALQAVSGVAAAAGGVAAGIATFIVALVVCATGFLALSRPR